MESTNRVEQTLTASRIVEKVTTRKIVKAAILIAVGAASIHFSYSIDHQPSLQLTVLFVGVGIALWGTFIGLFGSKEKVDSVSGKRVANIVRHYREGERNKIIQILDSNKPALLDSLTTKEHGDLQLSIYFTTDANYLSFQLFEWKEYTLRKISGVYLFEGAEAQKQAATLGLVKPR